MRFSRELNVIDAFVLDMDDTSSSRLPGNISKTDASRYHQTAPVVRRTLNPAAVRGLSQTPTASLDADLNIKCHHLRI